MIAHHTSILRILALSLALLAPAAAHAQADPQRTVTATALYEEALKEMHAAQYENACRKLEEVTRLAPDGLGAKLTLGKCYEALGKLASAWTQYALVEGMAPKMGQPERAEKAAQKAAELKQRLAMLTVRVPAQVAAIAGLSIMRDSVPVGEAQWGMPLPVDAGQHEIVVAAPGRKTSTQQVAVKANGEEVIVEVKPLEKPPEATAVPASAKPVPLPPAIAGRPWQRPAGIAAMVTGGVSIGIGAVLGGAAISQNNKSNDGHCNHKDQCDQMGVDLRKDAVALARGSTASIVIGGVALAGGITLLATAPAANRRGEPPNREHGARASIAVSLGGVQVKGVW